MNKIIVILIISAITILAGVFGEGVFKSFISDSNQKAFTKSFDVVRKQLSCEEIKQLIRDNKILGIVSSPPDPLSTTFEPPISTITLKDGASFEVDTQCIELAFKECGMSCRDILIPLTAP